MFVPSVVCADTGVGESPPADQTRASATAADSKTIRLNLRAMLHPSREHGKLGIVPDLFIKKVLIYAHRADAALTRDTHKYRISRNADRHLISPIVVVCTLADEDVDRWRGG